ncbi:MAG: carboxypeptidase regulatory-like domain-containing protein [Myxococcaceae bacterium]|nr:carboxypeptidase regulatory-like domain-containing protein [Myxococcaceae bacterium]
MFRVSLVVLLASAGCIELTLPDPPPPPGPGSIQGTAVYSVPGRTGYRPAGGTRITLVNTGTQTFADRETGRFDLRNVRISQGLVYFVFDLDGDGTPDRQRALELSAIGAGLGRDVALGEVVLSRNATVVGRVLRGDNPLPTGHAGTAVFVPGAPFATATADTGDFVLENLPEGPLQLAFYRLGYRAENRDLSVRGGEEARVAAASLAVDPQAMSASVTVTGTVRFEDGSPVPNARVRFVSGATSFTVTTDANGTFSAQTMSAQLYQVGIEADGATSLRLYNVLLLPGANELPPVQLARGESMPLDLDAGALVPFDGGLGTSPVAVISPRVLELAPGASGTLSSAFSSGRRPLTSHWRSAADGGLQLAFDTPDTTASSVRVFAPDAAGAYPFTLRVTDALGEDSPATSGTVRVGAPPTLTAMAVGGTTIAPGAQVTLQATAVSTDGRPITDYRWLQRTGPAPEMPSSPLGAMFTFRAPLVSGLTPMTFEVKATNDLGFESAPVTITLALQPVTQATLTAAATPAVVFQDGGQHLVQLNAGVIGGAPDASFTFSWAPLSDGCPLADGGRDLTCPEAWTLSNPTGSTVELFAPRAPGHRTLNFTVTATPGGLTSQVAVDVRDARPPSCRRVSLSTISLEVQCDEPMLVMGAFDAGPMGPLASVVADGGSVVAAFESVASRFPMDIDLPLVDLGGNPPAPFIVSGTPRLSYPATWVTPPSVTSTTMTRPTWLRLGPTASLPSRRALVGRATDATHRRLLVLDPTPCTGVCAVTPSVFENINGQGNQPARTTSAVSVDGRAYVIVSPENPPGLVEYRNGVWREVPVFLSPMLGALATDGRQLWVLSQDGGVVERRAWAPGDDGGSYGPPETLQAGLFDVTSAELAFTPQGRAFAVIIDNATPLQLQLTAPGVWSPAFDQLTLGNQLTSAKVVVFGESLHDALVFQFASDGFVEAAGWNSAQQQTLYAPAIPQMTGGVQDYDVARFGRGALVAWTTPSGELHLSLVARRPWLMVPDIVVNDVTLEDGGVLWNAQPARWPRVVVEGAEVLLSWQEEVGAGAYGMAGTIIR